MSEPWPADFDFYQSSSGEDRAIIMVNLGMGDLAPVGSHPLRVQFRVEMKQRHPIGLRTEEEAPALFALEDRIVETMQAKADAIYIGRVVAQGYTEFFFYVPAAQRVPLERASTLVGDEAPYEQLYPNRFARQSILNRRLIDQMLKSGDRLEIPREVDHAAWFPSRRQASQAREALSAAGYRVEAVREPDRAGGAWFLEFHKVERCDGGAPDDFTFAVLDLIEPHEGDYDGWGSAVQSA